MNVSLTPELESLIREKVRSGLYHSASEVVREALRLLKEHDGIREARLAELRKEIQVGLDQERQGRVKPLDPERLRARVRKAQKAPH
ncbi:MAG TPA: type II toxin-antitoxin system ParD family antitoxin [Phycisphaerae bacterium]|nr:type II toxin-antitoxin system ParD family antitoxin [Phycisphaerae bacterium]